MEGLGENSPPFSKVKLSIAVSSPVVRSMTWVEPLFVMRMQ